MGQHYWNEPEVPSSVNLHISYMHTKWNDGCENLIVDFTYFFVHEHNEIFCCKDTINCHKNGPYHLMRYVSIFCILVNIRYSFYIQSLSGLIFYFDERNLRQD